MQSILEMSGVQNEQKQNSCQHTYIVFPIIFVNFKPKDSIDRILERFHEREDLEEVDGQHLLVDMPDDFYSQKVITSKQALSSVLM